MMVGLCVWGGQDKTNHSEQIPSLILKGQWDHLSPEGKLESNLAECLLALAPALRGRRRPPEPDKGDPTQPCFLCAAGQGVSAASV